MSETNYRERAAEFNEKMGLTDPEDYWEDALVRFSVIGEEAGELLEAVNKDKDVPMELADIVITCYTGADTLDMELPEEFSIDESPSAEFEDRGREEAGRVFKSASDVYTAVSRRNENSVHTALVQTVANCHRAAQVLDVDLASEYEEKMDYNMQKSGEKVNGKPVDDVEEDT